MEIVQAVLLGLLQGVLEWLPVSSEGILTLVMTQFLGKTGFEAVGVSLWLHVGTMFAALLYFRQDFLELLNYLPEYLEGLLEGELTGEESRNVSSFLLVSTFASSVVGGVIYLFGLKYLSQYPRVFTALIGVALILTGVMKLLSEEGARKLEDIDLESSLIVGVLQGLAVIPGISRSGSTVFGLLYRDFSGEDAFKLSFLMSVPAVVIANIGMELIEGVILGPEMLVSMGAAFVAGYLSIGAVLEIAERMEIAYLCFLLAGLSFLPVLL